MPNDLQLSGDDDVLLESLVLSASDNVARAVESERDEFAPSRRRAFVSTDTNNVYLGTGDAWIDVSENTGFVSSLLGSDSVNTSEQNNTTYWVRGNRVSDIADTIDDAPVGAEIKLEAKTYGLDFLNEQDANENGLTVDKQVTITGAGDGSVIFLEDDTTETNVGANILSVTADDVVFKDFRINGNYQNNSPGEQGSVSDGHNIDVVGATNFRGYNLTSENGTGDGVEFLANSTGQMWGCRFLNNWEHNIGLNGCDEVLISNFICVGETNNASVGTFNGSGNPDTEGVNMAHGVIRGFESKGLRINSGEGQVRDCNFIDIKVDGSQSTTTPVQLTDGTGNNPPTNIKLRDLEIVDAADWGINMIGPKGVDVIDTTIRRTQRQSVRVRNPVDDVELKGLTIEDGNLGTDNNDDGVYFVTDDATDRIRVNDIQFQRSDGQSRAVRNAVNFTGGGSYGTETEVVDIRPNETGDYQANVVQTQFTTYDGMTRRIGTGVREESGSYTASGDGSTTQFGIPHNCTQVPDVLDIWAESSAARGNWSISSTNASTITIEYDTAPPSGTDNLSWGYHFRVDTA